jgi:RHH-type proline utilization regulon transcriptional repressor/proline dehydrogenase/delta 1-pyrroline-5-carboxylate dehydrogenase
VRRALGELDVPVFVETDDEWIARVRHERSARAPVACASSGAGAPATSEALQEALAATDGDPDLAVYAHDVTTAGRLELLPFLHEQSVSITAHRFGNRIGGARRSSDACGLMDAVQEDAGRRKNLSFWRGRPAGVSM